MEMLTTKRTRNPTKSPDKPADKSVKLDMCVSCQSAVSDHDKSIACCWCGKWEHRIFVNIKQSEFVMLESSFKNILFFCSLCIINLPKVLSFFENKSQLDERLQAKFQSVEDNLSQKIIDIETKLHDFSKYVLGAYSTTEEGLHNQSQGYLVIDIRAERKGETPI